MALGHAAISEAAVSELIAPGARTSSGALAEAPDSTAGNFRVADHGSGAPAESADGAAASAHAAEHIAGALAGASDNVSANAHIALALSGTPAETADLFTGVSLSFVPTVDPDYLLRPRARLRALVAAPRLRMVAPHRFAASS
jgi:hypothetical protein